MLKKWTPYLKGCSIIQHFSSLDFEMLDRIGDRLNTLLKTLENPVAAIVCLVNNPKTDYSHTISRTTRTNFNRSLAIKNALRKYPLTEMIVVEGGTDITLYSGRPFHE